MQTISFPVRCDRDAIARLASEIRSALAAGPVTVDTSDVQRFGQQSLQLLVASMVTATATGASLRILPSSALTESARLTGLDGALFEGVQP